MKAGIIGSYDIGVMYVVLGFTLCWSDGLSRIFAIVVWVAVSQVVESWRKGKLGMMSTLVFVCIKMVSSREVLGVWSGCRIGDSDRISVKTK